MSHIADQLDQIEAMWTCLIKGDTNDLLLETYYAINCQTRHLVNAPSNFKN